MCRKVWSGNLKQRGYSNDLIVNMRIALIDVKEAEWESEDWIHLAQDADRWRHFVSTVMNCRVA